MCASKNECINKKDLCEMIKKAFSNAKKKTNNELFDKNGNKTRSSTWVLELAKQFQKKYSVDKTNAKNSKYWVFAKKIEESKAPFGLQELLYDLHICKIGNIKSVNGHEILFVEKSLWQIESEFNTNSREVTKDFQKLATGIAPNKLKIGPKTEKWEDYISKRKGLLSIAKECSQNDTKLYFVLVPHPKEWGKQSCEELIKDISCFEFNGNEWESISY